MRVTIKAKLALAFGLIISMMGVAGYFAITGLHASNDRMQAFAAKPFVQVQRAGQLETRAINAERLFARTMLVPGDAERLKLQHDFQANEASFNSTLKDYVADLPADRKSLAQPLAEASARMMEAGYHGLEFAVKNGNNHATGIATGDASKSADIVAKALATVHERAAAGTPLRDAAAALELQLDSVRRDVYRLIVETDDDVCKALRAKLETTLQALGRDLQQMVAGGRDGGYETEAAAMATGWKAFESFARQAADLGTANDDAKALAIYVGPFTDARTAVQAEAAKLKAFEDSVANGFVTDTQTSYETARTLLLALVIGAIVIGLGMALWMALSISRGLSRAVVLAQDVASGDLTREIKVSGRDEIADLERAMKSMTEKLRAVVGQVSGAAQNVSTGSTELSASAEQLSEGSTEQAASTEEASASMEQMAANVKQNADNASQTEKIASQSARDAEASGVAVGRAVDAMQTIASKITIVQEIARQTDLLALNAAVEAARAGEHGRGFAVVASEVRKLAERSQAAAAEIGTLSADTLKVAQEAGSMLGRLVPDIKRTAELVEEITSACREQDVGASQINQAIQQLDKVTQQNAAASEEVSTTSEELSSQAEQLQSSIAFFRTTEAPRVQIDRTVKQLRVTATAAMANRPKRPPAAKAKPALKAAAGGFAFDMDDSGDHHDADFHRP